MHTTTGLTLLGLLLYVTITSGVLLAVSGVTLNMLRTSARAVHEQSRQYALSFAYARLAYDIGNADSVTVPEAGSTSTTLELIASGSVITYSIADGRVWVSTDSSDPMPLTPSDVLIQQSEFSVSPSLLAVPPVQWRVQTVAQDPLRATITEAHPVITMTWYPYAYE